MKRLVIFDLDGTLLDTIEDLATAVNHTLALHGYPLHDVAEYPHFVGNGVDKLLERALPAYARNREEVLRIKPQFLSYYDTHNMVYTTEYEGITSLLTQLQQAGVKLAVASNKYHSATQAIVAHYFPHIHFSIILGQREGIPSKPHPAIVNEILDTTRVEACDTLYVGDSDVDMLTARGATVESVGVSWGFRSEQNLREAGACHIIHNPKDLLSYIS